MTNSSPSQEEIDELLVKMREHERVCFGITYVNKNIDPIISYIGTLESDNKLMRETLKDIAPTGFSLGLPIVWCEEDEPASAQRAMEVLSTITIK
jgi:hypothetical protein